MFYAHSNSRLKIQRVLQVAVPAMAFFLFAAVAVVSTSQAIQTSSSLSVFKKNVLDQSATSNDSALAASVISYKFSEFLRGEDVEEELRARMDVLSTQLHLGQVNFEGSAIDHINISHEMWEELKLDLV
jgi:hypothetical protein